MKTIIITGANRGIGKATAKKFLEEGWQVVGTSTSGQGWDHKNLSWVQLELTDSNSIGNAVGYFKKHGPVDVLFNNAGVWPDEEESEDTMISIPVLRHILEVNLIGTIDLTEQMLSKSLVKSDGHIVSMGSMAGVISQGVGGMVPSYKISKVGLSMYTRTLAARLRDTNITVSILDPGWVQTDMGGDEAPRSPEEPANECFELVIKDIPSGKFWREGKERSW